MLETTVTDYARTQLWCNPGQDHQHIFKPARITPPGGTQYAATVLGQSFSLPTRTGIYHLFQLGDIDPSLLNLVAPTQLPVRDLWVNASEHIAELSTLFEVYTDTGLQLPKFSLFTLYTQEGALVLAVQAVPELGVDYATTPLYFRVYRNAFFEDPRYSALNLKLEVLSQRIHSSAEALAIQAQYETYAARQGTTFCYVNGRLVGGLSLVTMRIGDVAEYLYDPSVVRIANFSAAGLKNFISSLDGEAKYLLHYDGADPGTIDYFDDAELYVLRQSGNYLIGRYCHRNQAKTLRTVSHRDYSLSVPNATYFLDQLRSDLPSGLTNADLTFRLYLRQGGYTGRALVHAAHKLHELYKLPSPLISDILTGEVASFSDWQAAQLEQGAVATWMRSTSSSQTPDLAIAALGYNALSQVLGDSPVMTVADSGAPQAPLSPGLQLGATVYEYSASGRLLGYYPTSADPIYTAQHTDTAWIEPIGGVGSPHPDRWFTAAGGAYPYAGNVRVYRCGNTPTGPDGQWVDITDTLEYTLAAGQFTFTGAETDCVLLVRNELRFLTQDLVMEVRHGTFQFTLEEQTDPEQDPTPASLPWEQLDVFLNGHPLVEGIDFIVEFPKVTVWAKRYWQDPPSEPQILHVRQLGFPASSLQHQPPVRTGFVHHGVVSDDDWFTVHQDQVLSIIIGGGLRPPSQVFFAEEAQGITQPSTWNGLPFAVKSLPVPVGSWLNRSTQALRDPALALNNRIEALLSLHLPAPEWDAVGTIPTLYPLYSPFIARLVAGFETGEISTAELAAATTDPAILTLCAPYESWLTADPAYGVNRVDPLYAVVHPVADTSLRAFTVDQLRVLSRALVLYQITGIDLAPFFTVTP